MSEPTGKEDIIKVKEELKKYSENQIVFNEPHVTQRCLIRDISKEEVVQNLLKPDKLVYAGKQESKFPNEKKYDLYFVFSNTRAYRLPVILKEKSLYVITVIKINRRWQGMVDKYERKHARL
ncbi:MAG: hypothetical protein QF917_04015 [Candidatus Woesearchaeota archaeon]|jgi:hypothetical protein|nr:hypothetical protein [Candidatus Woesearchaeota archaeon]|tara:strand:+ start:560 stop:925 length:366 start_codon:yes stop_codon:yes gene_type:complete